MINPEQYEACDVMTDKDASIFLPKAYKLMDWCRGTKVLDYGCGPGRRAFTYILPQVEKFEGKMYSLDISEDMVTYAKKTYPHPSVQYACGNIMGDFPWNNVKFDNILSFYVLHFIEDIRTAFKGFHEILNEGGHFGFLTLTAKSISTKALRLIATMDQWKEYMSDYNQFMVTWSEYKEEENLESSVPEEHFKSLLNDCGFHVKHLEVLHRGYKYDDIDLFLEICLVVNPFLYRIPPKLHLKLKEDYRTVVTGIVGCSRNTKEITISHEHVFAVVKKERGSSNGRRDRGL